MRLSIVLTLFAFLIFTNDAFAQDETPINRWSIDVTASNIMGRSYDYMGPFLGNLGRDSRFVNPHLNFAVRHSFSPVISMQGNLGWIQLRGDENKNPNHPYTSTMVTVGTQGNLYFLRAFETYRTARVVNPYIYLGVGGAFGEVNDLPNDRTVRIRNGFINAGVGAKFYVAERVDFLVQYNYMSFRTETIDGYRQFVGWERGSRLAGIGVGLSIKLGRSGQAHADWHLGHSRIDEAIRIAKDVEARQNELERRVVVVEDIQQQDHGQFRSRLDALEAERDQQYDFEALQQSQYEMNLKIQMLIDRVNALESRVTDYPTTIYRQGVSDVTPANVARGFYVQVYAGSRRHHADGALAIIKELFEDVHGMHNLNYIIHKPHRYYVVQIGPYNQMSDTDDILRKAKEVFHDSFIRQYR